MAIADITCPKGIYFFEGYLADVFCESSLTGSCDLFLALMSTKISTSKNIEHPRN